MAHDNKIEGSSARALAGLPEAQCSFGFSVRCDFVRSSDNLTLHWSWKFISKKQVP
jgi:hypothetical protein